MATCERLALPSPARPPQSCSPSPFLVVISHINFSSCECFNILDPAKQKQIADELERTPGEVTKKLEDMRNRLM
jgi:hypothetical protein